ncbi:hypothetical protein [Phenylobacterium sp.]|uniref:hypothetical protein n=1 Tax=Phenylobacterium sp. TaxID=1871053 RepID=UPI002DE79202|nr:hypothetical protein [Phenylobacterium sp.]
MLRPSQIAILTLVGLAFWAAATVSIRWSAYGLLDPTRGALMFATALPVGWLSVRATRSAARLAREQLAAGVLLAGAVAMLVDGAALRWAPQVYGDTEQLVRLGAAWLLWGYGVSLVLALIMSRAPAAATPPPAGSAP